MQQRVSDQKLLSPDTWLRAAEVEQHFPIKGNHLAQLRFRGEGPRYSRRGHLIVYRVADIADWLMEGMVDPRPPQVPEPKRGGVRRTRKPSA
jgi:hypothetical protein